jgi:hypothetical protein
MVQYDSRPYKKRKFEHRPASRKDLMKTPGEEGHMHTQGERPGAGPSLMILKWNQPCDNLILDFWPPQLRGNKFPFFKSADYDTLPQKPWQTDTSVLCRVIQSYSFWLAVVVHTCNPGHS